MQVDLKLEERTGIGQVRLSGLRAEHLGERAGQEKASRSRTVGSRGRHEALAHSLRYGVTVSLWTIGKELSGCSW